MSEPSRRAPGHERRVLARNVCFSQFVMAYVCAGSLWYSRTNHEVRTLGLIGLPAACAAAFLLTLTVGFPALCPWPRLKPVIAITMPAMFCALLLAITSLLTARQSALIQPNAAQKFMEVWYEPRSIIVLFLTQAAILFLAAVMFRPSAPTPTS